MLALVLGLSGCSGADLTSAPASEQNSAGAPTYAPAETDAAPGTAAAEVFIELVSHGQSEYAIVYSGDLDDSPRPAGKSTSGYDVEVEEAVNIQKYIKSLTGCEIPLLKDCDSTGEKEILIGETARPEYQAAAQSIAVNEYGAALQGEKLVLAAHNLSTVILASSVLKTLLRTYTAEESDGTKSIRIPSGTRLMERSNSWYTDFPEFAGGTLRGTYDCGNNTLEYLYEGVPEQDFRSYWKTLEDAGFRREASSNLFGLLSATYVGDKGMLHFYYIPADDALRLISAPDGQYDLPDHWTGENPAEDPVTTPRVIQFPTKYASNVAAGMGYVMTLSDGSFIVMDGGKDGGIGNAMKLLDLLKKMNARPDGQIVIAAWIVTHDHTDHFTNFQSLIHSFGSQIRLEAIYINGTARSAVMNSGDPAYYIAGSYKEISEKVGGTRLIKLHAGMHFFIRDAEFEILFSQDDIYPERCHTFNDTSTVLRMTFGGNTFLWTGDGQSIPSEVLVRWYGDRVESDFIQVAHHGAPGLSTECYEAFRGTTLFWPDVRESFLKQITGTYYKDGDCMASRYLYETYGEDHIYTADQVTVFSLPYHPGDPVGEWEY